MNVSKVAKLIFFADDTDKFISDSDLHFLIVKANNELSKLPLIFQVDELSLIIKKTNFILFQSKNKVINVNIQLHYNDINRVIATKFLGVIINDTLT